MKLFYDHIYGNTTKYDIIYGLALAEVEPHEQDEALEMGWTPMDAFFYLTDKQLWIQARTTRYDLNKFSVKRKHRRYMKSGVEGKLFHDKNPYSKECADIFEEYCAYRNFDPHYNAGLVDKEYGDKDYFVYWHEGKVVAYTQLTRYRYSVVAGEFAWNYKTPELGLGVFAQNFELDEYKRIDFKYYYSSYAYEKTCEYKSYYNGFEWWTGREWSDDKLKFRNLVNEDSKVETLDDLYHRHQKYYSLAP